MGFGDYKKFLSEQNTGRENGTNQNKSLIDIYFSFPPNIYIKCLNSVKSNENGTFYKAITKPHLDGTYECLHNERSK